MDNGAKPTVAILGCGYVGLTTAAILANCGYKTYALEPLTARLDVIKSGKSFFYEAGIDPLIAEGLANDMLIPTDSYEEAVSSAGIIFCCMGTPDNPDGSSNLTYVFGAAEEAAKYVDSSAIFVQKSTVPVGTGNEVREIFERAGVTVPYVSNPEFLREGTAIIDTLWTDRIVVGSDDAGAAERVIDLYKTIEAEQENLAKVAQLEAPKQHSPALYLAMGQSAAELVKVSANAFLALKISFANSIAKLADQAGANVVQVMDAVGADQRIGRAFLNAGRGYGGGCFPKDVSGLIRSAEDHGVSMEIMNAVTDVNSSMPHYIINRAEKMMPGETVDGKKIAVLGLSFKAGTSDTRRSPAIAIADTLLKMGAHVSAYDPEAIEEAKSDLDDNVQLCQSIEEAVDGVDAIFVATDWPEFKSYDWTQLSNVLVVDCMNCLDAKLLSQSSSVQYLGVGTS